jgi:hypothetical protein
VKVTRLTRVQQCDVDCVLIRCQTSSVLDPSDAARERLTRLHAHARLSRR